MVAETPNILWYCTDQQRFDTIGALGNPHVHTPNLDRLVAEGVAFTHAFCQSPICTPSRASFLTGKYPSTVHVNVNGIGTFPSQERLVTRRLADVGYDCGLVGKLHLAGAANGREPRTDDGYRFFAFSHDSQHVWPRGEDYVDWLRKRGEDPTFHLTYKTRPIHGLVEPTPERDNVPPSLHQTHWCTEEAIAFLSEERHRPWLLSINPFDPHPPYNPPWEYYRRFDPASLPGPSYRPSDLVTQARLAAVDFQSKPLPPEILAGQKIQAAYYAMIEQIDEQLGRLLEVLERTGQRERTVIIFTSDHGEMLGDHGLVFKGCRFYEGLTRVPLLWSWPGRFQAGRRSAALVELIDIAPTLLELASLPVPPAMQGRSLLPLLTGRAPVDTHRSFVRCEYYDALGAADHSFATMYREHRWKLVTYHGHDLGELYDLDADPHEFNDLWDDPAHQSIKADLVRKSFDATVQALDYGPRRVMPY